MEKSCMAEKENIHIGRYKVAQTGKLMDKTEKCRTNQLTDQINCRDLGSKSPTRKTTEGKSRSQKPIIVSCRSAGKPGKDERHNSREVGRSKSRGQKPKTCQELDSNGWRPTGQKTGPDGVLEEKEGTYVKNMALFWEQLSRQVKDQKRASPNIRLVFSFHFCLFWFQGKIQNRIFFLLFNT